MDIASSLVQAYDLSVLELLVEDSPEGHTLFKGMSLSTMIGTIYWIFLVCLGWSCSINGS